MSFRLTLTACVIVIIGLLAALLILVQVWTLDLVTEDAATSTMDSASRATISSLQVQVEMLSRMARALSFSPSVMDSSDPGDASPTARLLKGNLAQWPALDSIYVGYDNGYWLQVQRLDGLSGTQRDRVGGPTDAAYATTVTQWANGKELPTTRVFENKGGDRIGQTEIPPRGYDARERNWYMDARQSGQLTTSAPYLSFNLDVPMVTLSVPFDGKAHGVVGLDLKLDSSSGSASFTKFRKNGYLLIFDSEGTLIVHPQYAALFERYSRNAIGQRLPNVSDLQGTPEGRIIAEWDNSSPYRHKLHWRGGKDYFARLETITLGSNLAANVLLVAPADEFAESIRDLDRKARVLALLACLLFVPAAWIFGTRMSQTISDITAEAARLQTMAPPPETAIGSVIRELDILARTIYKSQRAIWLFSRLAPREIVRGVLDNSISTELGGTRQEITALFTDVRGFTTIAENADPDLLMQQTSRYFTALTDVILLEGGTVDKFIGDAVMAFWNAPNPQFDHCERACRAALRAKQANEAINRQFEAEGLPLFFTRFGVHVGEAVVGNLGSSERMNYTALGNIVNLAARLEGLNKQYGTQILVSESVYARVSGSFHFRFVDTVVAKGMTAQTKIYELLEEI